jgi:iron complex outermembrane receptor protein
LTQGGFWLVDTNIGLLTNDGHYGVSFFVKNLFNQNYYSNMSHPSELTAGSQSPAGNIYPDTVVGYYNKDAQRYFGVNLNINF